MEHPAVRIGRQHQARRHLVPAQLAVHPDDQHVLALPERVGAGEGKRQVAAHVAADGLAVQPHCRRVADRAEPDGGGPAAERQHPGRHLETALVPGRAELVADAGHLIVPRPRHPHRNGFAQVRHSVAFAPALATALAVAVALAFAVAVAVEPEEPDAGQVERQAALVGLRAQRGSAWTGHFTAPAVRPATRKRCMSRNPATTGTLTTSEAAIIWFQ